MEVTQEKDAPKPCFGLVNQVWMDLTMAKGWEVVVPYYSETLGRGYLVGSKKACVKAEEPPVLQIVVPIDCFNPLNMAFIVNLMETLTKEVETRIATEEEPSLPRSAKFEFNMAIIATDSTLVYYQLSSGLHCEGL